MIKFKIVLIALILTSVLISSCNRHNAQQKVSKQYYYTCPMHQDNIYYQAGKCPKCGMVLDAWDLENMPRESSGSTHGGNSGASGHSGHNH